MKKKWIWLLLPAALLLLILLHVHSLARLAPSEIVRQVPVLMYHAVGDDCWGEEHLFVRPAELEQQLQYLSENGYETIFFEDLAHLERYEKPVILTFDDGYDDNYTLLLPLLQKYHMKATIFMIAGDIGGPHKLTQPQLRELTQSGLVSIQSHGWSHKNMAAMGWTALVCELLRSKLALTLACGRVPTAVSYPNGKCTERTRTAAQTEQNLKTAYDQYQNFQRGTAPQQLAGLWEARTAAEKARNAVAEQEGKLAEYRENPLLQEMYREEETREAAWEAARSAEAMMLSLPTPVSSESLPA